MEKICSGRGFSTMSVVRKTRLNQAGKDRELHEVRRAADLANIFYVRQKETKGLGHAIWRASPASGSPARRKCRVVQLVVKAYNGAGGGVDIIVVLRVSAVEFHVIAHPGSVFQFQFIP